MSFLSTNTVKSTVNDAPKRLHNVRVDDMKVGGFDFSAGQFKDAKPHGSAFKGGPIQTSQLGDLAENKKRLAVSAAKKAAVAAAAATPAKRPKGKRGKKGTK